jgi:hypothetical protein
LTKKRIKKSQDAAIPLLLAQFSRLCDSTSHFAKIGSPLLGIAQRHRLHTFEKIKLAQQSPLKILALD